MLRRKIETKIEEFLSSNPDKVLIIQGARQVGKSFIVRYVGKKMFRNYVELNLLDDLNGDRRFQNVKNINDFYFLLGTIAGNNLGSKGDTLVFLDEIQAYPHIITMLKFLVQDNRFTYIASGSLLGVTLMNTISIPIGSIEVVDMYPLDFEEFLRANNVGDLAISKFKEYFDKRQGLDENMHNLMMKHFKNYLLIGGLPACVQLFVNEFNVQKIRKIQNETYKYYSMDASQYDKENKLKISRVFSLIPSNLENKKKRVVIKDIEGKRGKTSNDYREEFDYLVSSGVALEVKAISNPKFPLLESAQKNLLKLYLNDVGILTNLLYQNNVFAILNDEKSINLGTVYESVVAQELRAHSHNLCYYDNKQNGEVDFLIDNYDTLSVLPIEVKSGKDYKVHTALNHFVNTTDYNLKEAFVLSNNREVVRNGKITYLPIYYAMFI